MSDPLKPAGGAPAPLTQVDISALAAKSGPVDVSVSPQETLADADHRRWKDKTLFLIGIGGLSIFFVVCLGVLALGEQPPEEKRIWASAMASMVTGMLGYTIGRK
jgi:hypothetical protein